MFQSNDIVPNMKKTIIFSNQLQISANVLQKCSYNQTKNSENNRSDFRSGWNVVDRLICS